MRLSHSACLLCCSGLILFGGGRTAGAGDDVSADYERFNVHHVGSFPHLESQVTGFTPEGYDGDESPNNADAAVFAHCELFPPRRGATWGDLYGRDGESDIEFPAEATVQ